jgi:hypothetical protein
MTAAALTGKLALQLGLGGGVARVAPREPRDELTDLPAPQPDFDAVGGLGHPALREAGIRLDADLVEQRPEQRVSNARRGVAVARHVAVRQRDRDHVGQAVVRGLLVLRVPLLGVVVLAAADLAPGHLVRRDADRLDVVGLDPFVVKLDEEVDRRASRETSRPSTTPTWPMHGGDQLLEALAVAGGP